MAETPQFDSHKFWKEQDFQVSTRLHLQHWIWDYQLGYVLHPKIDIPKDKPFRVADIACSNGAWMLDVARQYPNATIEGFDLSSSNFINPGCLPSNIKFHAWNAFEAVPEEFVGSFDVVHIRTIYSAVINNNVEPLLENLLKMLKPGGYLQWDEQNPATLIADIPEGGSTEGKAVKTMATFFRNALYWERRMLPDWLNNLPTTIGKSGAEVLAADDIKQKKELQRASSDNFLSVWYGVIPMMPEQAFPVPKVVGLPEKMSRDIFIDLLKQAAEDCSNGAWIRADFFVCVARKGS